MTTGEVTRGQKLFEQNPAVRRKDWLPCDTPFDDLNALHDQHVALLEAQSDIGLERWVLEASYEAEDKGQAKSRTPQSKRADALDAIVDRAKQATLALYQFVEDAVATIQDHESEWCLELLANEQEAADRVEEARQALARAEADVEAAPKLRTWVERTAVDRQGWHLHWGWFGTTPTTDVLTIANEGMVPNAPPSEALRREREAQDPNAELPDYSDETHDYDSPDYQQELDRTIGGLVRGRRPGSATPGGI
jgi:phosphopantetheine adenylyltransferase